MECMASLGTSKDFDIAHYGGKDDGETDCRHAFRKAWDAAKHYGKEHNQPTRVLFRKRDKGVFLLRPLTLDGGNDMGVSIGDGVTLCALPYAKDKDKEIRKLYDDNGNIAIRFQGVHGLSIVGEDRESSVIQGNGPTWPGFTGDDPYPSRPFLLDIYKCHQVLATNFSIRDAPSFNLVFDQCHKGNVKYLTVTCPRDSNNTDGIHLNSSIGFELHDCTIHNGDDAVVIDAGEGRVSAEHTIHRLTIEWSHGISIGSAIQGTVKDLYIHHITLTRATNGIRFKSRTSDKGKVHNCTYSDFTMKNVQDPLVIELGTYGSGGGGGDSTPASSLEHITIKDIEATVDDTIQDPRAGIIDIAEEWTVRDFTIDNFTAKNYTQGWKYAGGSLSGFKVHDVSPPFPTSEKKR
jgi:polygalacturonase